MFYLLSFFIGLISGIFATLIAGNPQFRFHLEKFIRHLVKKPLVNTTLQTFRIFCQDGFVLLHCIVLKNSMWMTPKIPRVYFLSYGAFDRDSRAYKPFMYFRAHGMSDNRTDVTTHQLLKEFSSNIIPYAPDNPDLSIDISKNVPRRIVAIAETVNIEDEKKEVVPLNHLKKLGELYIGIDNPMPKVTTGAWWDISIISEDFGFVDKIDLVVPSNLEEKEPLGDSIDVLQMKERPPCLMDVSLDNLTWPLRLEIKDNRFKTPQKYWRLSHPRWGMAKQVKILGSK